MPYLSVCITCFNRPEHLVRTLQSLAGQTRQPDEVLVWDDHSTVDPSPWINQFASQFCRFSYHRQERNLGMPGNLNSVIRAAKGDLIANLHDADVYRPILLESWERALLEHSSAGIVFCGFDTQGHDKRAPRTWIPRFPSVMPGRAFFEAAYVGHSGSPIWGTVMARREVYERHLPFDARFGAWADVDMWMRVCSTHDICCVAEPLISLYEKSHFRDEFRWVTVRLLLDMYNLNIYRMARSDTELKLWLGRQRSHSLKLLARLMVGRLAKMELRQCATAVSMLGEWSRIIQGGLQRPDTRRAAAGLPPDS